MREQGAITRQEKAAIESRYMTKQGFRKKMLIDSSDN
jgi:hypothetical protein